MCRMHSVSLFASAACMAACAPRLPRDTAFPAPKLSCLRNERIEISLLLRLRIGLHISLILRRTDAIRCRDLLKRLALRPAIHDDAFAQSERRRFILELRRLIRRPRRGRNEFTLAPKPPPKLPRAAAPPPVNIPAAEAIPTPAIASPPRIGNPINRNFFFINLTI